MKHPMNRKIRTSTAIASLALLAGVLAACTSKSSPTAPTPGGGPGSSGGSGATAWNINVSASPSSLTLPSVSTDPVPTSTITVTVRNSSGNPPPNGTTIVVSSSSGTLAGTACSAATGGAGSGSSVICQLAGGQASLGFTPSGAGTVLITASLEQSSGSTQVLVNAAGPPTVFHLDHVTPNVGDPNGGIHASIFGQGFEAPISVLFGASNAQVLSVAPDHAVVVVPRSPTPVAVGATLAVNVTVNNAIGSTHPASDSLSNGFVYSNGGTVVQPQVFSVTPTTGPQEGHTQIVINGSGFQQPVQVLFRFSTLTGLDLEAPVVDATGSRLVVLTPDIRAYVASGALVNPVIATIRVINLNSGFSTDAAQTFAYGASMRITSVGPGTVPFDVPTLVTIFGSGFDEPVAVSIAVGGTQVAQQVISVSGTEIVIRTSVLSGGLIPPCGGSSGGPVTVTNIEGGATATGGTVSFTGPPRPIITGISPTGGPPGLLVQISGSGFPAQANLRVLFGGATGSSAPISSSTPTLINATVPNAPSGFAFDQGACDANGDGNPGGHQNVATSIDVTVRDLVTSCESTLTNAFLLTPSSTTCLDDPAPTTPPQCSDTFDNDGDTLIDAADPQCSSPSDNDEST